MTAPVSKSSLEVANHTGKGNSIRSIGTTSCSQPEDPARDMGRAMPLNHVLPSMQCRKCSKRGHYARVCRSKNVAALEEMTDLFKTAYLNSLGQHSAASTTTRTAEVTINRKVITFKLDTGAEVTLRGSFAGDREAKPGGSRQEASGSADLSCKQQTS